MSIRWRVSALGGDGKPPVVLGDVTAPDRRRAIETARRQWADRVIWVQSLASLAGVEEEQGALVRGREPPTNRARPADLGRGRS